VAGTLTFNAWSRFTTLLHMCQTTRRHIPKDTVHCLGTHYPKLPFSSHRYICVTTEAPNRASSPQILSIRDTATGIGTALRVGRSRNAGWILGRGNSRRRYSGKIMKLTTQLHLVPKWRMCRIVPTLPPVAVFNYAPLPLIRCFQIALSHLPSANGINLLFTQAVRLGFEVKTGS